MREREAWVRGRTAAALQKSQETLEKEHRAQAEQVADFPLFLKPGNPPGRSGGKSDSAPSGVPPQGMPSASSWTACQGAGRGESGHPHITPPSTGYRARGPSCGLDLLGNDLNVHFFGENTLHLRKLGCKPTPGRVQFAFLCTLLTSKSVDESYLKSTLKFSPFVHVILFHFCNNGMMVRTQGKTCWLY